MKEYTEVMNTYNAHNAELVRKINYLFCDEREIENRRHIIFALAQRDREEIKDKMNLEINSLDDVDVWDRDILMNICDDNDLEIIISFCYGNMDYRREEKLKTLRDLVRKSGKIYFDGDFVFCGDDRDGCESFCNGTELFALSLKENGELEIDDKWQGLDYTNSERYIPDFELDRMIEYVKEQTERRKNLLAAIHYQLTLLFGNYWTESDIEAVYEKIKNAVAEDVVETSNYPEYNTDDIQIGIRRVLMDKVCNQ